MDTNKKVNKKIKKDSVDIKDAKYDMNRGHLTTVDYVFYIALGILLIIFLIKLVLS